MKKNVPKFNKEFIKNYDEDSNRGYILEVDIEYRKDLHTLDSDLPFLSERMKIQKCNKLVCNLYDKKRICCSYKSSKTSIKPWINIKIHRVIQFNQEAWLKPYIESNTKLRAELKHDFEKDLFKLMNNSVFGKTMENVRKHRENKLVTTDKRANQLVPVDIYRTTKSFSEDLLAMEMKEIKVKMNKPVYLGLLILEISKTLMYEFWYGYIKLKYQNIAKLCYMDPQSFIIHIKTEYFFKDIADDVKKDDTSNY